MSAECVVEDAREEIRFSVCIYWEFKGGGGTLKSSALDALYTLIKVDFSLGLPFLKS